MTCPANPANRLRGGRGQRLRLTSALIAELAYRLTERDRAVIEAVWDHKVLTTGQLTAIFYPSTSKAQHRLLELHRLHMLERFQPWTPVGTRPMHWVLGPAGAYALAAQRGLTPSELGYRPEKAMAISLSPRLGHQVGVNDFFACLHGHARRRADGSTVAEWWPERRCASLWGDLARPDAFGRWIETADDGRPAGLDFFLEHDTGTETLTRVAEKLAGYTELTESTAITTPVLFWLPSAKREANLRKLLNTTEVLVATAVHTPVTAGAAGAAGDGPAGPVWLPAGVTGPRRRLAALADVWGGYGPDDPTETA